MGLRAGPEGCSRPTRRDGTELAVPENAPLGSINFVSLNFERVRTTQVRWDVLTLLDLSRLGGLVGLVGLSH